MNKRVKVSEKEETRNIVWIVQDGQGVKFHRCLYKKRVAEYLHRFYVENKQKEIEMRNDEHTRIESLDQHMFLMVTMYRVATLDPKDYKDMIKNYESKMDTLLFGSVMHGLLENKFMRYCATNNADYAIHVSLNY